jgi:hypothetical protein
MKTEAIIIRVDKKMKVDLEKIANDDRRKLSDFLRIMIEDKINEKKKK